MARAGIKQAIASALDEHDAKRAAAEEAAKNDRPLKTRADLEGLSVEDTNRRWSEISALLERGFDETDDDDDTEGAE